MPKSDDLVPYLVGAAAGALVAVALGHVLPCPFPLKRHAKRAYVLAVFMKLAPGTMEAFKRRWAPVAACCRSAREPGCLSYELSVAVDSPDELIIFERYVAKEDLDVTHRAQAEFKAFGKWLHEESGAELLKDGSKTIVRGAGFSQRPWFCFFFFSYLFSSPHCRQVLEKSNKSYVESNIGHMVRG